MTNPRVYDDHACSLGEGPLWHPERQQLFWFDINAHQMHSRQGEARRIWQFSDYVSAAGWLDHDHLIIARRGGLIRFNIETGEESLVVPLEAENPVTRPNDGRADPYGGFWIGTMGQQLEAGAGALYRFYRGELRQLYAPWSIPNAQCFSPDGSTAYLTDTPVGKIMRVRLDQDGWPDGDLEVFLDISKGEYRPDGAVVDARGHLWIAHYGYGKVTEFSPKGDALREIACPAAQTTCPAFGGADLSTLYITSAAQGLDAPNPADGTTQSLEMDVAGQAEHRVIL